MHRLLSTLNKVKLVSIYGPARTCNVSTATFGRSMGALRLIAVRSYGKQSTDAKRYVEPDEDHRRGGKDSRASAGRQTDLGGATRIESSVIRTSSGRVLDLSFQNAREAYRSKSLFELFRALVVFSMFSFDKVVEHHKTLLKMIEKVFGEKVFKRLMKLTFFGHFIAGENQQDIKPLIGQMRAYGVHPILDYSAEKDVSDEEAKERYSQVFNESIAAIQKGNDRLREMEFVENLPQTYSARTYFYEGESKCDENMKIFLGCIDAVSDAAEHGQGFAAVKLTALGRPELLLKISEVLVKLEQVYDALTQQSRSRNVLSVRRDLLVSDPLEPTIFMKRLKEIGIELDVDESKRWFTLLDVTGDGVIDLLDWQQLLEVRMSLAKLLTVRNLSTALDKATDSKSKSALDGLTLRPEDFISSLTDEGIEEMKNMLVRINTIVSYARDKRVRVMVDAEQSYFQPAIRRFTLEMMRKFNRERCVIFNTYQCYLHEAYHQLVIDLNLALREGWQFGAKLVRGAYLEQETLRSQTLGIENPVLPSFDHTSYQYERCLDCLLEHVDRRPRGHVQVIAATHNEDTVRMTVRKMIQHKIEPSEGIVSFGQLLGMSDQVSFALGQAGYLVYKYVPYGPVGEVVPYLSRRAMENRGLLKKVKKEKRLLRQEILRRLVTFDFLRSSTLPVSASSAVAK